MRFIFRSLTGLFVLCLTLALLLLAGRQVADAVKAREEAQNRRPAGAERVFSVNVARLDEVVAQPKIRTFGEIESRRTLEVRAGSEGELVDLAADFRDGGVVRAAELLFRVDPADAASALDLADIELREAEAEMAEAEGALALAQDELAAAEEQRRLQEAALARQRDLRTRGVTSETIVETATMALSQAAQTVIGRRQALLQAESRVARAEIALDRRRVARADAARTLSKTETFAPFTGILTDVNAVLGRRVTTNEELAVLIDPTALEAAFRVTNAQFGRLLAAPGGLSAAQVVVTLEIDTIPLEIGGEIVRAGAEVGEGQTGRVLYAALDGPGVDALRPGDFVTVEIIEPPLPGVAEIPTTAATEDGRILLVTETDRLEEVAARILRRQSDTLIVGDVPFGQRYVMERLQQLGPGVRVRPVEPQTDPTDTPNQVAAAPTANDAARELVTLEPAERARLRGFVEGARQMPEEVRARLLAALDAPQVPKALVDRLEARFGG
ncbi:MAG: HlyD family efflux transporter periplasmic adaptor subunit [Pseudomonadota bacterium]